MKQRIYHSSVRRPTNVAEDVRYGRRFTAELVKYIKDVDKLLRSGKDTATIYLIETRTKMIQEAMTESGAGQPSEALDYLGDDQMNKKAKNFGLGKLGFCLDSMPFLVKSLNKKRALVLLKIFGEEELHDAAKANDITRALIMLNIRDAAKQQELIDLAKSLPQEIEQYKRGFVFTKVVRGRRVHRVATEVERNRTSVLMDKRYVWWFRTRLNMNDEQIEVVTNKLDGKPLDKWANYIEQCLAVPLDKGTSRSTFEAKKKINGTPADPKQRSSDDDIDAGNGSANTKKLLPGKPRTLSPDEVNELIVDNAALVLQHPVPSYEEMIERVLAELNKVQTFKALDYDEEKLQELLIKLGLTKEAYELIQRYRELSKSQKNGVILEELSEALGNPKALDTTIKVVNNTGFADIQLSEPNDETVVKQESKNPIVGINIPLLDTVGLPYGDGQGFPSHHYIAIKYTDIGNHDKKEAWHGDFHRLHMKKIIPVEVVFADRTKLNLTIRSAEAGAIVADLREGDESHVNLSHYIREEI